MKTEQEIIEQFRHEWGGMILDAVTCGLHGDALSLFTRGILRKVDVTIAKMYRTINEPPQPKPAANGAAQTKVGAK